MQLAAARAAFFALLLAVVTIVAVSGSALYSFPNFVVFIGIVIEAGVVHELFSVHGVIGFGDGVSSGTHFCIHFTLPVHVAVDLNSPPLESLVVSMSQSRVLLRGIGVQDGAPSALHLIGMSLGWSLVQFSLSDRSALAMAP